MEMRDPKVVSYNMSRIKGKDTSIEIRLRTALYHLGYRYQKNVKELPGKPDIVFKGKKVCIFCDGDFFHGYDLRTIESQLKSNKEFWDNKIKRNRERDRKNDEKLVSLGYVVLHFWEHEINQDINKVIAEIEQCLQARPE